MWHSSAAGVKIFAHIQQVTNLSAPASTAARVRFRWLNAKGRLIKTQELRTARCEQPATPAPSRRHRPDEHHSRGHHDGRRKRASS